MPRQGVLTIQGVLFYLSASLRGNTIPQAPEARPEVSPGQSPGSGMEKKKSAVGATHLCFRILCNLFPEQTQAVT